MTNDAKGLALVLGATGGVGGAIAERLLAGGWNVRALVRDGTAAADRWDRPGPRPEWIAGDAMSQADVVRAAKGADIIVHAVNPPGYRGWARLVLPMITNSIAAAEAAGARIVLPGTIYNYDPLTQKVVVEDSAQPGLSDKGAIRVRLEAMLEQAGARGVRSLIVRAGDFFGPGAKQSWFTQAMIQPGKPVRRIIAPGRAGAGHSWAYLPDLAEAVARLLDAEDRLATFERVHFHGHWDHDGRQMIEAIAETVGRPDMGAWRFPWWLTTLAAPFSETMREMREIKPYWHNTLRIAGSRMEELLGREPHTPLEEAVRRALVALNCLEGDRTAVRNMLPCG